MNGNPYFEEASSGLRVDKMQFAIINRRPHYTKDMHEKTKSDIEGQLFDIFKKYV